MPQQLRHSVTVHWEDRKVNDWTQAVVQFRRVLPTRIRSELFSNSFKIYSTFNVMNKQAAYCKFIF
jgi:hypothetical protein